MSFGGGGFTGFGSNNNNTSSPFGGGTGGAFGSNTNPGFGSNTNSGSIFGSNTGGTSMFGGNNTNSSSTFGSGGFGASNTNNNTTTALGSKPFGAANTGGLFGNSSGSTFGSGFGSGTTTNTSAPAFGGGNQSGGLFGANKPAFGSGSTTANTGGLFGGGNATGGFGTTNTGTGFGASTSTGFGAQSNQTNTGTGGQPFNAISEKDGTNATQQYQTITFMEPYKNWSLEELRAVDYNQGRRYGNQNGQAGAFGQTTGFGGFSGSNTTTNTTFGANTSGGGLFGNNSSTPATGAFGSTNTTNTFGGSTNTSGGGLFGQNKPAGGLFGGGATQPAATSGGLFGGSTSGTGAFGSGGTGFGNTNASAGGMFGNNNNNNQTQAAKPFGFGTSASTPAPTNNLFGSSTTAFGGNNATSGGLFGGGQQAQASTTPFGGNNQQPAATGGLFGGGGGGAFGGQNQQNQTQNQSGGLFSGFGNAQQNQQKPAGSLFGGASTTATGGGLFGNNQQQSTPGLFGNSAAQNQTGGGGLFGAAKPATTSLFGTGNAGGTTGGLFGASTQNTQQNTGGLFGAQSKPSTGGLFGGSTTNMGTGGGLFGASNQNNAPLGNSLFSSQNQSQQPQQSTMGNSLFNASGNSLLQTSMNTNPYGNDALFAGLSTPTQSPGPLATPLSSSTKKRAPAILPQHKLNPSASTRLLTPQNRRTGGYGFTYSTYGTPNSVSSNPSPGFSGSLFGTGSISRSLAKSMSTSNLRNSFTPETSILNPGAFSTSTARSFANGSLKKLNINRAINNRVPLFDDPSPDKKRVSFAGTSSQDSATNGTVTNGSTSNALVVRQDSEDDAPTPPSTLNGGSVNGSSGRQEVEQVSSSEAPPASTRALNSRTASSLNLRGPNGQVADPKPGDYWSEPSIQEIDNMSREERRNVVFTVGREQIGQIQFNLGRPIDLNGVQFNKLFGDIVQLNTRNATVYGETTTVPKPALGTGLNHPSRIILANSWPRNKAGKKDQKHLERLKRVAGTTFEKYDSLTGEWTFTVPHFSTYGLNDSDYSDDEEEEESSELSPVPNTPAQGPPSHATGTPQDDSFVSPSQSSPDDTFDFKKGKRLRASVPGGFGDEAAYEEDADMDLSMNTDGKSFLGERSVGSLDGQHDADYSEEGESGLVEDQDMADSVSSPIQTTEQSIAKDKGSDPFKDSIMPKSILKVGQTLRPTFGTPSKGHFVFDDDWANQLQRTISPKKQDRHALRESQGNALRERDINVNTRVTEAEQSNGSAIPSKLDLMESLFSGTNQGDSMTKRAGHGIELPYSKRPKTSHELERLSDSDKAFHSCNKPHFSETGTLLYATKLGPSTLEGGLFRTVQDPIIGAHKDIRFTKLPTFPDAVPEPLSILKEITKITNTKGVPVADIPIEPPLPNFSEVARLVTLDTTTGIHEQQAWKLLSILFDEDTVTDLPGDLTREMVEQNKERYRKDKLSDFWETLVYSDADRHAQQAASPEEKAIAYLSGHHVSDACQSLLEGLDLRLATMVAQIGGDHHMRQDMTSQIDEWRRMDILAEMDEPIRALYELLAGNCAQSEGKFGPGRENRASTFRISSRFGLDWRRAFGLRLWYGTLVDEPIELAVAQFADALRDGQEDALPRPWFIEQGVDMGWEDPHPDNREDLLWGILKLYASAKMDLPANVEDVLAPENVSGHPLNARLSFQLFRWLKHRLDDPDEADERKVAMPTTRQTNDDQDPFRSSTASKMDLDEQAENPLVELGDKLALTYAASLHTKEHWTTALWVYTHLSSPAMREHYIRSLLAQYSRSYSITESDDTYTYLVGPLRIPATWLHTAAALQAKTDGDAVRQVEHLIKADELEEAHEVLRRIVGPEAIISRDYDILRELLGNFLPSPSRSPVDGASTASYHIPQKNMVKGWGQGGQIYFEYIELLDLTSQRSNYRVDEDLEDRIKGLLSSLQTALEIVARDSWKSCRLEERAALTEISGVVAGLSTKIKNADRSRVLKLPLTEDLWLKHSLALSVVYYRSVMATGR